MREESCNNLEVRHEDANNGMQNCVQPLCSCVLEWDAEGAVHTHLRSQHTVRLACCATGSLATIAKLASLIVCRFTVGPCEICISVYDVPRTALHRSGTLPTWKAPSPSAAVPLRPAHVHRQNTSEQSRRAQYAYTYSPDHHKSSSVRHSCWLPNYSCGRSCLEKGNENMPYFHRCYHHTYLGTLRLQLASTAAMNAARAW